MAKKRKKPKQLNITKKEWMARNRKALALVKELQKVTNEMSRQVFKKEAERQAARSGVDKVRRLQKMLNEHNDRVRQAVQKEREQDKKAKHRPRTKLGEKKSGSV